MFFHSDLFVNGELRLSVRHGQAGFFTDEELKSSEGVLWDAGAVSAPALRGSHAPPRIAGLPRSFDRGAVAAFAQGRVRDCFGPEFTRTAAHSRTPRIPGRRMQLIDEVTAFEPTGGPWSRGYLCARKTIAADDWFFAGHFKNDPCMPGTLMLEGAVQSLAFYLTALGCTLHADGWRFEPVADETIAMRCRGQCVPTSRELIYEVFVEEFTDGPQPRLRATVLASVDGLKAFLAQGVAVELVPDWPLEQLLRRGELAVSNVGTNWSFDGFAFDHRSLLACALGKPSESFGPAFRALDGAVRIPRLPRPPYHFMTRVVACTAERARAQPGVIMEAEFDFRADDWFFAANGAATMPSCVFMEALLQPCGWLSSFVRDASAQTSDIFFRNLDGTLRWERAIPPSDGTLTVRTELTNWSELGTMIIVAFRVQTRRQGEPIATMETSFGFFPGDAFANQAGLAPTALETRYAVEAPNLDLQLRGDARGEFAQAGAKLADDPLLMIDRLTGWWPEAGAAGLGVLRGEKDVIASDWFFNAHFMRDPVQPGSLGIEALAQLLQGAMRQRGLGDAFDAPEFEPLALGEPLTWKYRGQVVPENRRIMTLVEITEVITGVSAILARARGSVWVDGKKIYEAPQLAMRVRDRGKDAPVRTPDDETVFSFVAHPWLDDHRPSFTTAVVPLTVLLDEVAVAGARHQPGLHVTELRDFFPSRWVTCADESSTRILVHWTEPAADQTRQTLGEAKLSVWREARREGLSRFDEIGRAGVVFADEFPSPPEALAPLAAPRRESPYTTGETTHGPAFQVLRELRRSSTGASCVMDAGGGAVPFGQINPALLDSCTHAVPFSRFAEWYPEVADHWNGLPRGVHVVRFFGPTPTTGIVRCEIRPRGTDARSGMPRTYVQFIVGERVWCELEMEFALLDATPFLQASFAARTGFLQRGEYCPTIRLSRMDNRETVLRVPAMLACQWMPLQLEAMFGLKGALEPLPLAEAIATRECVAHELSIHPARVQVTEGVATAVELPIQTVPLTVRRIADEVRVSRGKVLLRRPVGATFFAGAFLTDLAEAVGRQHVRYFRLVAPEAAASVRGRPVIICSNHQTALESLVFTDLFMRWSGCPLTTVTRVEHQHSWVGQLTDLLWRYPRRTVDVHPQMLFNRDLPESFLELADAFRITQTHSPHALHLHVEGEQARRAAHPVGRMSAAIVDLALSADMPILPVKFSGGLPVEPVADILSLPWMYGRQNYTVGAPLSVEELRALPRPKAAERVVAAINALPPSATSEVALSDAAGVAEQIRKFRGEYGVGDVQAALLVALAQLETPSSVTRAILEQASLRGAETEVSVTECAWHDEFTQWLWRRDDDWHAASESWKKTARS